jgi:hypothetical protein
MPFPRFTSGRTGNLTFSLLNEMMERIEAVERATGAKAIKLPGQLPPFLARVLSLNTANGIEYAFEEVAYPTSHSISSPIVVSGGRTSRQDANLYAFPLIGSGLAIGQVVFAFPVYDQDSRLVFHTVESAGGAMTKVAQVVSFATMQTNTRWTYLMRPVKIDPNSSYPNFTWIQNGPDFAALNGAENVTDTTTIKGVGAEPPIGPTYTRMPIKAGVIAPCTIDSDRNYWLFSVPNGYKVVCP